MKSDFGFGILMHLMAIRFAKLQTCSKVICCDASDTGNGFRVRDRSFFMGGGGGRGAVDMVNKLGSGCAPRHSS